ncbi:MAG: LLM class flavin-dependent oxidoreductase [Gammaproteobacteria bacterium]|nr:LLM class flavin-dependent oxidoreductase [Gammaproteobacteria bacterium]
MRLGALLGPVTGNSPPDFLAEQARTYANAGFDSLWSAQALGRGFMLPDPFVALSVAATAADVEIGTAVVQAPLYDPMDLAHRVFSLQQICGDRLTMGLGAGSTASVRPTDVFARPAPELARALAAPDNAEAGAMWVVEGDFSECSR